MVILTNIRSLKHCQLIFIVRGTIKKDTSPSQQPKSNKYVFFLKTNIYILLRINQNKQ